MLFYVHKHPPMPDTIYKKKEKKLLHIKRGFAFIFSHLYAILEFQGYYTRRGKGQECEIHVKFLYFLYDFY